jgi:hypothetical protein
MPKPLHHIAVPGLLLVLVWLHAAPAFAAERMHRGIRLLAFAADNPARDIAHTPPEQALQRLARAFDTLTGHSPANARAIQTLRNHGTVLLVYYPGALRSRQSLNAETVALYLPDFLKKRGKSLGPGHEFIVVVNHLGIRWPARELAGLIAHELVGHGGQHRRGELRRGRPLDLECQASLHEEQAYQDLRLRKSEQAMVAFRKRLESHHCADFRHYMAQFRPKMMRLWIPRNPDVPALLREFERYRTAQVKERKKRGISRRNR